MLYSRLLNVEIRTADNITETRSRDEDIITPTHLQITENGIVAANSTQDILTRFALEKLAAPDFGGPRICAVCDLPLGRGPSSIRVVSSTCDITCCVVWSAAQRYSSGLPCFCAWSVVTVVTMATMAVRLLKSGSKHLQAGAWRARHFSSLADNSSPGATAVTGKAPKLAARDMEPRKYKRQLVLGAVCYSITVGSIWKGMMRHFNRQGLDIDYVMFTNYERQNRCVVDIRTPAVGWTKCLPSDRLCLPHSLPIAEHCWMVKLISPGTGPLHTLALFALDTLSYRWECAIQIATL